MSVFTNITKGGTIAAFSVASGVTTYLLFQLPESMPQYSAAIDLSIVEQLSPLLFQTYISVGLTILLGFSAITILLNSKSQHINQVAEFRVLDQYKVESDSFNAENISDKSHSEKFYLGEPNDILSTEEDKAKVFNQALSQVCKALEASQGAVYQVIEEEENKKIELFSSYAYHIPEGDKVTFRWGEGLVGQSAKEGQVLNIDAVPEGYIQIFSGLGKATPEHLLIAPIKKEETVVGVLELSSFKPFEQNQITAIEGFFGKLALKLSNNDNVSLEAAKL